MRVRLDAGYARQLRDEGKRAWAIARTIGIETSGIANVQSSGQLVCFLLNKAKCLRTFSLSAE